MNKIIECVPNVSEGRDPVKIASFVKAIENVRGVRLCDVHSDRDHNRSVFTFMGEMDAVLEAALAVAEVAVECLDINEHEGAHPRIGVLDVVPFVPLVGVTMEEVVRLARIFGNLFAHRFQVPVYYYEEAATSVERKNLSRIRKGGLEGLRSRITDEEWLPDEGPASCHARYGATAVGARNPLVAYNVNLASSDLHLARTIARAVRESGGGLPHVKALGLLLQSRGIVQVSMNLTDYRVTSIQRAYDEVKSLAGKSGVEVVDSELVGLAPQAVLNEEIARHIKLMGGYAANRTIEFHVEQILLTRENKAC